MARINALYGIYIHQVPLDAEKLYSYTYNDSKTAPSSFPLGTPLNNYHLPGPITYKTTWAHNATSGSGHMPAG